MAINNKQESRIYNANNSPVTFIADKAEAITPSDTTVFTPSSIYVGVGGDIVVKLKDDTSTVTFVGVPTGTILPILATMVYSTGTTATDMLMLR